MEEHTQDCGKLCACFEKGAAQGYKEAEEDLNPQIETLQAEVLSLEEEIESFKAKMDNIRDATLY